MNSAELKKNIVLKENIFRFFFLKKFFDENFMVLFSYSNELLKCECIHVGDVNQAIKIALKTYQGRERPFPTKAHPED